jgi:hypothetical protein
MPIGETDESYFTGIQWVTEVVPGDLVRKLLSRISNSSSNSLLTKSPVDRGAKTIQSCC